jgi:inner membrane protein YidH
MIRNFGDHAANERTFLAWVRTAIAVMAFGFLVERFDLFLRLAGLARPGPMPEAPASGLGHAAGLVVIGLGGAMILLAAVRFLRLSRQIDSPQPRTAAGLPLGLALAALLVLLCLVLVVYLARAGGAAG